MTEFLCVDEVARILKLGRSKVYQMVAQGELPSVRFGKKAIRVPVEGLQAWIRDQRVETQSRPDETPGTLGADGLNR